MKFSDYRPMLATSGAVFDAKDFLYELKWDGYRTIAISHPSIRLYSRNGRDLGGRFPEIAQALSGSMWPTSFVFDGEIVVLDEHGFPSFSRIQRRGQVRRPQMVTSCMQQDPATYVIFDVLYLNGECLCNQEFHRRRSALERIVPEDIRHILLSPAVEESGKALFNFVRQQNLEGVMAKAKNSVYLPGKRTRQWIKIKNRRRTDCVVVGYTPGHVGIKSLLLGQYSQGDLIYVGQVGTGFSTRDRQMIQDGLQRIWTPISLLVHPPTIPQAVWVLGSIVVAVEYAEYTEDQQLRQASFLKVLPGKRAEACTYATESDGSH